MTPDGRTQPPHAILSRLPQRALRCGKRWARLLLQDRWLLGYYVERAGNVSSIDGALFGLDIPYITTPLKSRFLLNAWEREARGLIKRFLPRDLPVLEIGARFGVVAITTNRLLDDPTAHVAVEANPHLIVPLMENRDRNGCQFEVVHAALGHLRQPITFRTRAGDGELSTRAWSGPAPTKTLKELLDSAEFETASLICNVDGGEVELITFEAQTLQKRIAWLFIELYDGGDISSCTTHERLLGLGFALVAQRQPQRVYHNRHAA